MFKKLFGCGEKSKKKPDQSKSDKKTNVSQKTKSDADRPPKQKQPASNKPQAASKPDRPAKPRAGGKQSSKSRKKRKKNVSDTTHVDVSRPLEFPCTPEIILEHHKHKPFLNENEEWLLVELNEYECLVDDLEIVKVIAKHSKFFEADPPELWEEFFEFVDDVPSYDEVINYDVWQEFRDKVYAC